jgi:hypothetical protein
MLFLFPCPGTIPAPSCWLSCQTSCYAPPFIWLCRSGVVLPLHCHCPVAGTPLLHHPSRVAGRDCLRQPPQGLYGSGCHTWKPATLWPTAGQEPRRSCRHQAGLVFKPAGFYSFFSGADSRRSRNRFPTWGGDFCMPGTGGAFTVSTDAAPSMSAGTASEVRPLTSSPSSRGQN